MKTRKLHIEELEQRIAPDTEPGLLGYEWEPGNHWGPAASPPGSSGTHAPAGEQPESGL